MSEHRQYSLVERKIGNQWLITSPDLPGLFVSHSDLAVARGDVLPTIRAMERVRERVNSRNPLGE